MSSRWDVHAGSVQITDQFSTKCSNWINPFVHPRLRYGLPKMIADTACQFNMEKGWSACTFVIDQILITMEQSMLLKPLWALPETHVSTFIEFEAHSQELHEICFYVIPYLHLCTTMQESVQSRTERGTQQSAIWTPFGLLILDFLT